jgi:hypothetical protein
MLDSRKTEEIDAIIEAGNKAALDKAFSQIKAIQRGEIPPIMTGIDHLDGFLPSGLNNQWIFYGSRPSMGKTHMAQKLKKNLLSDEVNPLIDIAVLTLNWEMQLKSLLLRDMKQALNKGIRDILSKEFSAEEGGKANEAVKQYYDPNTLDFDQTIVGEEFKYLIKKFREKHEGKEIVVIIDHIHVILTKKEIDEFNRVCNDLKKEFTDISFIIFFQLRRDIEQRWRGTGEAKINPKNFLPNSSDIYNTDTLYQFADIILTSVIPQVVDMDEYTTVNKERNQHLIEHFIGDGKDNKTARLKGRNRVFYNYIKIRNNDDFEAPRLFCDIINPDIEDIITDLYYSDDAKNKVATAKPSFPPPGGGETPIVHPFSLNNSSAQGEGFEDKSEDGNETKAPFE